MSRYRNKKPKNKSNKINLPNGFGQISKLSGARRNPYAVYPPAKRVEELGPDGLMRIRYKRQPALCYVDNWTVAFMILTKYHANDYKVGDEIELTKTYYAKHKTEINDLLHEALWSCGTNNPKDLFGDKWDVEDPLALDTYNQNLLAWFGFEETMRKIAYNFEDLANKI